MSKVTALDASESVLLSVRQYFEMNAIIPLAPSTFGKIITPSTLDKFISNNIWCSSNT